MPYNYRQQRGNGYVFAFDGGQSSVPPAPFDAPEVIDGYGVITIEDTEYRVETGQQIIMPNKPHAVDAPEKFKMVLIMIRSGQQL